MKYPTKCELCNSPKIVACDECEQALSFYCNRCGEMFEVEKPAEGQDVWCDSKSLCAHCGLHTATLFVNGSNSCNECEFNRMRKSKP